MIIAIPSVTTYISNSRKSFYIDTAKNIIGGSRNLVNEEKLEMYDQTVHFIFQKVVLKRKMEVKLLMVNLEKMELMLE